MAFSVIQLNEDGRKGNFTARDVAELAREIWTEHYTPLIGAEQVEYMLSKFQSEEQIQEDIAHNGFRYYLAIDDASGKPVGYSAAVSKPEVMFLSKVYVHRDYRKQGIANAFLSEAKSFAKEKGQGRIQLTVNKGNSGSIAAYKAMGFEKVAEAVSDIGEGFVMDDFIMELEA